MDDIQFTKNYSALIDPGYSTRTTQTAQKQSEAQAQSFGQLFQQAVGETGSSLTFSKHALQRMDERSIELTPQTLQQMDGAVGRAQSKGVKEALILNGGTAYIVSIPNKTVITAMNGDEMKDSVFTNIDGAVIL